MFVDTILLRGFYHTFMFVDTILLRGFYHTFMFDRTVQDRVLMYGIGTGIVRGALIDFECACCLASLIDLAVSSN